MHQDKGNDHQDPTMIADADNDDEEEEEILLSSALPATEPESPDSSVDKTAALTPTSSSSSSSIPPQKFFSMDKVVARDRDGVLYESVVRRAIYGSGQAEPIQLGLCSHAEAQALIQESNKNDTEEPPCWHYFIHYNKWNCIWDRWVGEYDVYEPSEDIRNYAKRIMEEHKVLRNEMARKIKGKKSFQTIDGAKFLQEWRKRISKIDIELNIQNPRFTSASLLQQQQQQNAQGKKDEKSSAEVESSSSAFAQKDKINILLAERGLREKGLTKGEDSSATNNKIILPFGLKRACVEQWEIITQCGMLTHLPAPVTVRDALDEYLKSKGVVDPLLLCQPPPLNDTKQLSNKKLPLSKDAASVVERPPTKDQEGSGAEVKDAVPHSNKMEIDKGNVGSLETAESANGNSNQDAPTTPEKSDEDRAWIDMAQGIAQFFDEALPYRLLYREEYPQLRVVQRTPEFADKPYSAIYGCEYLLRMLTRLPDLLMKDLTPEESRPIFAKLNDLARFLHKNQSLYFAAYHRKPSGDEQMEALRMEARRQKKRAKRSVPPEKTKPEKKIKLETFSPEAKAESSDDSKKGPIPSKKEFTEPQKAT